MGVQEIVYFVTMVILWALIVVNFLGIRRNRRLTKDLEKSLDGCEAMCKEYEAMRNKYIELLDEQWKNTD